MDRLNAWGVRYVHLDALLPDGLIRGQWRLAKGSRHFCNNFDGPASGLAEAMARHNGYPVRPDMGYPAPGSLGSWAGRDRGIPTVTLELPAESDVDQLWQTNGKALIMLVHSRPVDVAR